MSKKALIIGITGQDGAYLSRHLLEKCYKVYGALRKKIEFSPHKLKALGIDREIHYVPLEIIEFSNILHAIQKISPDEIYNLAAQSSVSLSFEQPMYTADVTAMGALRVLEAVRTINPGIRFYQASSSEMFGKIREERQNEQTAFYPRSPYAVSKSFAHWMAVNYREAYGLFACSGILFNHESPLRELEFVTRKITYAAVNIKLGFQDTLYLGNMDSRRDWGYAPEYVEAMWLMMQQPEADDYIIATGETHSIREFVETAFQEVGTDIIWQGSGGNEIGMDNNSGKKLVRINPQFFRPAEVDIVKGDFSKAKEKLGWAPKTTFKELVRIMVMHDLEVVSREKVKP